MSNEINHDNFRATIACDPTQEALEFYISLQETDNKAAEEGELPALLAEILHSCNRGTSGRIIISHADEEKLHAAIAADRAARPVANKAEVEPIYQIQYVDEKGSSIWHDSTEEAYHTFVLARRRIVYATPPATTGASTVLTDKQVEIVAEIIYKRMPADATGDPKKYPWVKRGNSHKQEDARSAAREVLKKLQVAAQAGQVAVPEGFSLLPKVMTSAMINAWSGGRTVSSDSVAARTTFQDAWKRVLEAAPSPASESLRSPQEAAGTEKGESK